MDPKVLSRLAMGVCLILSVLLIIFFFLALVECGPSDKAKETAKKFGGELKEEDTEGMTASGLQLTIGTVTMPEKDSKESKEEADKAVSARPWFILSLLVPLAALAAAGAGLMGKMPTGLCGVALAVLGILGLLLIIMAVNTDYVGDIVDYQVEKMKEAKAPESAIENAKKEGRKLLEESMDVSGTGIGWTSFVLYIVILLGGAAVVVAPALGGKGGACCSQTPTPSA